MPSRDDADYVEFVASVQDGLRRTAYLMTGDWGLAADITQEAMVKLYLAWPRLERGPGLASYARRAVVTLTIDHKRKRARRREVSLADTSADVAVPDGTAERAEHAALFEALRRIPDRQRACIVLRYFEELSIAETAEALRCSEGNVKSQTSHGIAALRRELELMGMPEASAALLGGVA